MHPSEPAPPAVPLWQRLVIGRHPKLTLIRAATLAVLAVIVFKYLLLPVRISGPSMEPTYRDGRVNFINLLAYRWSQPRRGDVVAVRFSGPHVMYFKRIIGLPGETVAITHGTVLIDGQPLDEPYVRNRAAWNEPPQKLAADEYFVIGDNRGMPQQMHEHGRSAADRVMGKALW